MSDPAAATYTGQIPASSDAIAARAREIGQAGAGSIEDLISMAGGERRALEAARDLEAGRVHERVDDFAATAALRVLNRALSAMPRSDPLDWRVRWKQRFRKP